jgi:4-carboxymuconolactone decarboxylase
MKASRETASRQSALELCAFAAAVVSHDPARATTALVSARRRGVPRRAAEECALMLVLYGGYPAALEGARTLAAAWPGRTARPARMRKDTRAMWRRRGAALCRRIYGPVYPRLIAAVQALHPDLAAWMIEEGYGRVLARPGLGVRERELITVAVLAATGWRRQLVSHLIGAVRLAVDPDLVRSAFARGLVHANAAARRESRAAWREAMGDGARSPASG